MPASWDLVVCSPLGDEMGSLDTPFTIRYELDRPAAVTTKGLAVGDPAAILLADQLQDGWPQLRGYRRDSITGPLRFSGQLAAIAAEADDDSSSLDCVFRDPLATLEHRYTSRMFGAVTAGSIIATLIADANTNAPTGLRMGAVAAGTTLDRSYDRSTVSDAITGVCSTDTDGGVDVSLEPLDPIEQAGMLGELTVIESLGTDRHDTVRFELGPDTLSNVARARQEMTPPRNVVTTTVNGVAATVTDSESVSKWGRWEHVEETPDAQDDADLTARATKLLAADPVQVVTFEPLVADSNHDPWRDYWLGDTVGVRAVDGALRIDQAVRITAIEIDVDESGLEVAHRFEFGDPRARTLPQRIRQIESRIYYLEREGV